MPKILNWFATDEWMTRKQLTQVPGPTPRTLSHYPIAHHQLADLVVKTIQSAGFDITDEQYLTSHKHDRLFALLGVTSPRLQALTETISWIGIRNSHDTSIGLHILGGNIRMLCSNMQAYADVEYHTKHTKHVFNRVQGLMPTAIHRMLQQLLQAENIEATWRGLKLHEDTAKVLLVDMVEQAIITGSNIPTILTEYREPSHDYGYDKDTIWSLVQAITATALKPTNASQLHKMTGQQAALTKFVNERIGYKLSGDI